MRVGLLAALAIAAFGAIASSSFARSEGASDALTEELRRTTNRLWASIIEAPRVGRVDPSMLNRIDRRTLEWGDARLAVTERARQYPAEASKLLARAIELDRKLMTDGQAMTKAREHIVLWRQILVQLAFFAREDRALIVRSAPELRNQNAQHRADIAQLEATAAVFRLPGYPGPDAYMARSYAPAGCRSDLTWKHPRLRNPVIVPITTGGSRVELESGRNYILDLGDRVVESSVHVIGGGSIVAAGGRVRVPIGDGFGPGLALKNQDVGATISIESIEFSGPALTDGLFVQQPNDNTVRIQNVRVSELHSSDEVNFSTTHPDVLQTNSGPDVLEIDRLSGVTPYQGIFLKPNDRAAPASGNMPTRADLRRIDIRTMPDRMSPRSALMWKHDSFALDSREIWVDGGTRRDDSLFRPSRETWSGARIGLPPWGPFVPPGATSNRSCTDPGV